MGCAGPRRLCIPETTQGEAFQHNRFLRREQKSDTGMLSPLHLIKTRENGEGIV
ncbi:MAG: hypothetical protein F6J93_11280 [Oscillatoria sp. SIO1A7]|nr:hypothetical protein [Oscillatoria sp. SIO1A7]